MEDRKYKIIKDNSRYGELEVEWDNGVRLILTDAKTIYRDDWNSIREYLYSISFMPDGYSLITYIVDEDVAKKVITDNVIGILHHGGHRLKGYLEELNRKLSYVGEGAQTS